MATGESIVDFEEPLVQGNGRERWFLTSKGPVAEPPRRSDRAFRRAPRCHREKRLVKMKGLADTDALTGVANRRMFNEAIAEEFARAPGRIRSQPVADRCRSLQGLQRYLRSSRRKQLPKDDWGGPQVDCQATPRPRCAIWRGGVRHSAARHRQGWRAAACQDAALGIASARNPAQRKQQSDRDGQYRRGEHLRSICDAVRTGRGHGPGALRGEEACRKV